MSPSFSSSWIRVHCAILVDYIYLNYVAYLWLQDLFNESDIHHERNYFVGKPYEAWTGLIGCRLLLGIACVSTISWFVRYRFLNMYTRLPPEPQRKEPQIDLYPDMPEEDLKSGLSNYLDEFLSAIKIFGYLERPVFHELTRSMQTRKLAAGETFNLEEEQGFCLVVDGLVEIFVKSSRDARPANTATHNNYESGDSSGEEAHGSSNQRYQLLTEVRNGSPMSSLFTILSLFTEDVPLRYASEGDSLLSSTEMGAGKSQHSTQASGKVAEHDLPPSIPTSPFFGAVSEPYHEQTHSTRTSKQTKGQALPKVPHLSLDSDREPAQQRPKIRRTHTNSVHPDIVARAVIDTTIAIIPASAFRRLTRIYPKASSHIVQVILTRLQRVTLATGHSYLGLTKEVLRTETHMNRYTTYELPNFLRGNALDRLKAKFRRTKDQIGAEDSSKGIALHNSASGHNRRPSSTLRKDATLHVATGRLTNIKNADDIIRQSGIHPSPGDLLNHMRVARKGGRRPTMSSMQGLPLELSPSDPQTPLAAPKMQNPFFATPFNPRITLQRQESIDEDGLFRTSILECMLKAIGLTKTRNALRMTDSVEASPNLTSYDQHGPRSAASIQNAFGFMEQFDDTVDDLESVTSGGVSAGGYATTSNLANDLKDEVEIVYFPQGSVLVEEGERNPGLYYVIDGFLDVSIPAQEPSESTVLGSSFHTAKRRNADEKRKVKSTLPRSFAAGEHSRDAKTRKNAGRQSLALIKPGGLAGYIGTISSYRSFIDVLAKTDVYVGFLPRASLERIVEKYPIVLLTMAKRLTSLLQPLILHIDFALDWVQVNAGQVIYHQGDESDAIYIVLNGRLRLVYNNEQAGMKVVGEYGQGESIGELEVMTESVRPATLHAIRDTELARFPRTLFNSLAQEHPGITIKISKIIASRMRALVEGPTLMPSKEQGLPTTSGRGTSTLNLRTVAILPVTVGVPVVEFGSRLMSALSQIGAPKGVTTLNQTAILNHLGRHAFSRMGKLKLSQYLADFEEKYGLVLYVAGTSWHNSTVLLRQ